MDTISRNNYEVWFIDYLDGQLDCGQVDQLLDFLNENPDLRNELEAAAGIRLTITEDQMDNKDALKYSATDIPGVPHSDYRCIARMEGDLPPGENERFDEELAANDRLKSQFAAYEQTRLVPDDTIQYPNHGQLKRKVRVMGTWWLSISSAAAVLLLALILWPQRNMDTSTVATLGDTPDQAEVLVEPIDNEQVKPAEPVISMASLSPIPVKVLAKAVEKPAVVITTPPVERELRLIQPLEAKILLTKLSVPDPELSQINLASLTADQRVENPHEYQTLGQLALNFFRQEVLGQDPDLVKQTRFSMWEVADAGINKISSIVGSDAQLNCQYNKDGSVVAVSFNSRLMDVEAPVRQND